MQITALDNVRKKFMEALNAIGFFLQTDHVKKTKVKKHPKKTAPAFPHEKRDEKLPQDDLDFKGSGYMGKGHINTDAAIFNRPRKEVPRGRDTNEM